MAGYVKSHFRTAPVALVLFAKLALIAGAAWLIGRGYFGSGTGIVVLHGLVLAVVAAFLFFGGIRHRLLLRSSVHREGAPSKGIVLHGAGAYDLVAWLFTLGRERKFRQSMLRCARLRPGESVLDVGCGTGTLAIAAKREVGVAGSIVGLDASAEMIERARSKAARASVDATFVDGAAQSLPFADASFDCVLGTLMLHHLSKPARIEFFREARRVLRPGGRLLLIDFAKPERRSRMPRLHRHGHVNMEAIGDIVATSGFDVIAIGGVGTRNLRFLEAVRRSPHTTGAGATARDALPAEPFVQGGA